jgi:hypothetical protein
MLSEKTPWTIKGSSSLSCGRVSGGAGRTEEKSYLRLGVDALVIAVGSSAKRGAGGIAAGDSAALGEVFLALSLADFHLLFLSTTAEFIGLEDALGLEGIATMLGDVSLSHGGLDGRGSVVGDFGGARCGGAQEQQAAGRLTDEEERIDGGLDLGSKKQKRTETVSDG